MINKKITVNVLVFLFFGLLNTVFAQELPEEFAEEKPDSQYQRPVSFIIYDRDYNLDPHTACYNSEGQILNGIYEGLFSYNPKTLEAVPAIAESYEQSADKKTWTFTIRESAKFSNGKQISPEDIRISWLTLLQNPDAQFASLLDCIKGVSKFRQSGPKAKDKTVGIKAEGNKLILTLNEPTEHLPQILCHHAFSIVPQEKNVYSGAYILAEQNKNGIKFKKNPNYWDYANVMIPEINFVFSSNEKENTLSFNAGESEWVISSFDPKTIISQNSLKISPQFGTTFLFFKNKKGSIWNDAELRTALIKACPWEKLRNGMLIPASTLIFPLEDYPQRKGLVETDKYRAKELLKSAQKRLKIKDKNLIVKIALPKGQNYQEIAQILKDAWEDVGVKVQVESTPEERYLDSIPGWEADIFSYSWIGDFADPMAFLELFRSDSSLNVSAWSSTKFDRLLSDSAQKTGADRMKILADAEDLLLNESEILPINHSININLIDTDVLGGWYINSLDIHPLKSIFIKKQKSSIPNIVFKRNNSNRV